MLEELENWYRAQCNGDWEHSYGVEISTLDNPGWIVKINLADTDLERRPFRELSYGTGVDSKPIDEDWLVCKVENNIFHGAGGPSKLRELIRVFLDWAQSNNPALGQ